VHVFSGVTPVTTHWSLGTVMQVGHGVTGSLMQVGDPAPAGVCAGDSDAADAWTVYKTARLDDLAVMCPPSAPPSAPDRVGVHTDPGAEVGAATDTGGPVYSVV